MLRYVVKRFLELVPTLLGATALVFLMIHLAPGGPVEYLLGPFATEEDIVRTEHALGLDRPLPEQYITYVGRVIQGDLGTSIRTGRPVLESLLQRLPYTGQVLILSILFSALAAFPVGLFAGIKSRSKFDSVTMIGVLVGVSMPSFWLALMLILLFAVRLAILPLYGMPLITQELKEGFASALLPAVSMGAYQTAVLCRTIRGEMIEVLSQGYIRLAKGFGLPGWKIYLKYALKNVLIPVTTLLGLQVRYGFGAAAVIETIFAIPGIGQYLVIGILSRDYLVVQGTLLMFAVIFSVVNLIVDVTYAFIDPRIKW
jgi:peptide/nickel transport system permease protein